MGVGGIYITLHSKTQQKVDLVEISCGGGGGWGHENLKIEKWKIILEDTHAHTHTYWHAHFGSLWNKSSHSRTGVKKKKMPPMLTFNTNYEQRRAFGAFNR